ncbi:hypothetical protein ACVWZW_005197 [Bradyrhizobium sp. F1.13.4]
MGKKRVRGDGMSNIVELPLPTRMITEEEVAKLHSNAFRDLETPIRDCLMMGKITEQLMSEADHGSHSELVFAMFHLSPNARQAGSQLSCRMAWGAYMRLMRALWA